ncbi:restriction endonuclease subunit S [Desulfosporosinus sp. OT]|uniref:restriction endonuclease subunit S n=1 Tax=Desulfosporosinus sp. OT TaxID=913865 RepID=UPI000223AD0E|nr:restriction endonuclease subunit S [Desulfosporosinus sp. OT]EGW41752.1 type I restriction modification DNA specificity domain protein [Desulfosporosinus sp. OT]
MARAEKQTALTLEERLKKALVPDWEQPYKVPENWVWSRAGIISELNPPKQQPKDLETKITFVPMAAVSEVSGSIETPEIRPAKSVVKGFTSFREGDVIFAKITPCMENGKAAIAENLENKFGYGSTEFFVLRPSNAINKKLLYYFLRNPAFRDEAKQNMSGAVGQQRVSKEFLGQHGFPLPPLAEQQRIVNRIESLFSKLDEAKEKVQSVLDSFETRKAAILYKAFTGELTAKWREKHGVGMETWKAGALIEYLIQKPRNGYSPTPVNHPTKVKSMTLSATTSGVFLPEYFKYIDEEVPNDSHLWLNPGDILIQRANSLEKVGTSAIFTGKKHEFIYPDLMMKLQVNFRALSKFIAYLLKTDAVLQYFRNNATGTAGNMPKINQKVVANTPVVVPTTPEQQEIVYILDDLFAKEQQAKDACTDMLGQIDLIKKSILARAFRGELGTNDPTEESALELLKQCLAQQANEKEQTPKKKRAPTIVLSDQVHSQLSSKLERDIYLLLQKNGPSNMREIASISKKDLDVIEALRHLESKGLIQKQSDGEYGCVR